jgi:hypothetical protein
VANSGRQTWIDKDLAELTRRVNAGESSVSIATVLNRTRRAVDMKISDLGLTGKRTRAGVVPANVDPVKAEQDRAERAKLLREERELVKAVAGERSLRAYLDSLIRDVVQPYPVIAKPKQIAIANDTVVETLHLQLSDWHFGQIVDPERTRGFNQYDSVIARARVERVIAAVRSIAARMRRGKGWSFPRIVVGLNGDLVTGTIHELERHSDGRNIVETVYDCGRLLADAVSSLAADFEAVDLFCTSGNHGRLPDAKRVQQNDPTRSWDTVVAMFAREMLRSSDRVRIEIPYSYSVAYDIEGHTFLQQHGHDLRVFGSNPIPYYGMARYMGQMMALEAMRGGKISYFTVGHLHNGASIPGPSAGVKMFVNGSIIGGTEFSVNALGRSDKPMQMLLGVHAEHGVTHQWDVLADPQSAVPNLGTGRAA